MTTPHTPRDPRNLEFCRKTLASLMNCKDSKKIEGAAELFPAGDFCGQPVQFEQILATLGELAREGVIVALDGVEPLIERLSLNSGDQESWSVIVAEIRNLRGVGDDPDWWIQNAYDHTLQWRLMQEGERAGLGIKPGEVQVVIEGLYRLKERGGRSGQSSTFETLDVASIIREGIPPIEWDLDEFLVHQTLTYLTGIWKGYKTFLACSWSVALVSGSTFCGLPTRGDHRILFLEGEYPKQIPIRIQRLCLGFQVNPEKVLERIRFIVPRGLFRLEDPSHAAALIQEAKNFKATMVVLDSLRRLTAAKENSSDEMAMVANIGLLPLRDRAGTGVLVLDHPSRPWPAGPRLKKLEARGSGDKIAAADVQIHIDTINTPTGKISAVSVAASRVSPERDEPLYLRLRDTVNGGIRFEETEAPTDTSRGRPPSAIEKARLIIQEESKRNLELTRAQAIAACIASGVSQSTAKRAWAEMKEKVQGSEG